MARWVMAEITSRLQRRIDLDFPDDPETVAQLVRGAAEHEGVQAAVVLWAKGDRNRLDNAVAVAGKDWRDALVRAGLENDDWRNRLDVELGPS
jgi:hypothetical protein